MKKVTVLLLTLVLSLSFTVSALALGTDDGSISVADRGGQKFFGTKITSGLTEYEAANGSGETFYDINGDRDMNICDLVALNSNSVDFDLSGTFDSADAAALRLILIGAN